MNEDNARGNAAIVEVIREHGLSWGVDHIPYVAAEIIYQIEKEGTLFVASKEVNKPGEERELSFFFLKNLKECWSIGYTSREECELDHCKEYAEISWQELFRRILDDPLITGLILNPSGARYPIPQELMKDILEIVKSQNA